WRTSGLPLIAPRVLALAPRRSVRRGRGSGLRRCFLAAGQAHTFATASFLIWQENFSGSEQAHQQKKQEGGRNVQVEVHKTVHQQPAARGPAAQSQGICERVAFCLKEAQGAEDQDSQKPSAAESADDTRFGERLQVVIVRVIHNLPIVESFIRRIYLLESSEPGAENRMIEE